VAIYQRSKIAKDFFPAFRLRKTEKNEYVLPFLFLSNLNTLKIRMSNAVELGSFCRERGLTERGKTALASLTAVVLEQNLNKSLQKSGFNNETLSQEQIAYCALYVFAPSEVYQYARVKPAINIANIHEQDALVLYTPDSRKHAAHGKFLSLYEAGREVMCRISISDSKDILIPSAKYKILGIETSLKNLDRPCYFVRKSTSGCASHCGYQTACIQEHPTI
jgi:hypothetical protein